MRLSFHPAVQRDVNEITDYYHRESGEALAGRFFRAMSSRLEDIAAHPESFPFFLKTAPLRRARLRQFPQVIVYRILSDRIRVTVIKHEKRHPSFGMSRR
jgi:toxin ParE1/3/4